jgi:hypothetical protein
LIFFGSGSRTRAERGRALSRWALQVCPDGRGASVFLALVAMCQALKPPAEPREGEPEVPPLF